MVITIVIPTYEPNEMYNDWIQIESGNRCKRSRELCRFLLWIAVNSEIGKIIKWLPELNLICTKLPLWFIQTDRYRESTSSPLFPGVFKNRNELCRCIYQRTVTIIVQKNSWWNASTIAWGQSLIKPTNVRPTDKMRSKNRRFDNHPGDPATPPSSPRVTSRGLRNTRNFILDETSQRIWCLLWIARDLVDVSRYQLCSHYMRRNALCLRHMCRNALVSPRCVEACRAVIPWDWGDHHIELQKSHRCVSRKQHVRDQKTTRAGVSLFFRFSVWVSRVPNSSCTCKICNARLVQGIVETFVK